MIYTYEHLGANGRLGNQLWQIAATLGSVNVGDKAAFDPDWVYRKYFSLPSHMFDMPFGDITDLGTGYYQSMEYWGEPDIIDLCFEWSEYADDIARSIYGENDHSECVAVHIRRGDYLNHPNHFPIPTSKYYQEAVSRLRKNGTVFYMFSDDIDWCRSHLDYFGLTSDETVFVDDSKATPVEVVDRVEEPTDWRDMWLMSQCGYHIISNSTFAWWGAYLANGKTVFYPSVWFGPAVAKAGDPVDCPKVDGWIEIEC